jgi:hypothetical protein
VAACGEEGRRRRDWVWASGGEPLVHRAAGVDEVVGDHAEPDPALHAGGLASGAAAGEAVHSLDDAGNVHTPWPAPLRLRLVVVAVP